MVPSTGAYGPTRMRVVCMSNAGGSAINMGRAKLPQDLELRGLEAQRTIQLY